MSPTSATDLSVDHGPTIPAWSLIVTRVIATAVIALVCQLPAWLAVVAPLAAIYPSGAMVVIVGLAYAGIVGWLPERAPLGSGEPLYPHWWWAAIAISLIALTVIIISARLTDKVSATSAIEIRAITHLALRLLPALVLAEAMWALAVFVIAPRAGASSAFLLIGALALGGIGLLILILFAPRRRARR